MFQGNAYSPDKNVTFLLFLTGPHETKENLQFNVVCHKINIELDILIKSIITMSFWLFRNHIKTDNFINKYIKVRKKILCK